MRTLMSISLLALLVGCGNSVVEPTAEVVHCRVITGERTARTIDTWKFEMVQQAIKGAPIEAPGLTLDEITTALARRHQDLAENLSKYETEVPLILLELEVRGELSRLPEFDGQDSTPSDIRFVTGHSETNS